MFRPSVAVLAWLALVLWPAPAPAAEMLVLHLDPERSSLEFVLDATMHKVEGHLGSASGRIAFDPETGLATGEVEIDLTGADTGIERRDRKMHEQVLETDRHPTAVYTVERVDLPGPVQQGRNEVQLHGVLDFHGSTHQVAVPAVAVLDGQRVSATGWLEIPYVDWGLTDPSFFVLRVGKTVRVELEVAGTIEGEVPEASASPPHPR